MSIDEAIREFEEEKRKKKKEKDDIGWQSHAS